MQDPDDVLLHLLLVQAVEIRLLQRKLLVEGVPVLSSVSAVQPRNGLIVWAVGLLAFLERILDIGLLVARVVSDFVDLSE